MDKAKTFNEKDIKKTVRGKKNISNVKPYLFAPLKLKWPQLGTSKQELILKNLKKCFMEKNLKSSLLKMPSKEEKKKVFRPLNKIQLSNEDLNIRSQLITGIKEVTRYAEQNSLKFIFIDRSSPWQLHRHLIQIAATYHCHAAAIDNLSDLIAPLLGLSCLSALAFKKIKEKDSKFFVTILEQFEALIPLIEIPFLSNNFEDIDLEKPENSINRALYDQIFPSTPVIISKQNNSNVSENVSESQNIINITLDQALLNKKINIPDNICFLKKRKIENQELIPIDNSNGNINLIKLGVNIENDALFSKVSVFASKKVKQDPIIEIIKMDIQNSAYIRSDVRKKEKTI